MTRTDEETSVEVVVIGGGMAGMSMALALDSAGVRTAVVDTLTPDQMTAAPFDGRVSALAHCATEMFRALDVWPLIQAEAQPIRDIRVSDGEAPRFLHFDHRELGDAPFGHLVENRHIREALLKRLGDAAGVTHVAGDAVTALNRDAGGVAATLRSGAVIRARLAIGADGRGSPTREGAGIRSVGWRYGQTGIVVTVAHDRDHRGIAHERFLPAGPFAILPMTGRRSSLVWTERAETAPALMRLNDDRFAEELTARFGDFLGTVSPVGPRWSYPLAFHHAESYIAPRLALIGDAAHGIHPIAGQGLNLGLKDVAALAEVVADHRRLGLDIGSPEMLEAYQRWRRFDTVTLAVVTDGLNRLFSNDIAPVRAARDLGLAVVNRIGPARRFFMAHARGTVGKLPRLLTGHPL